MGIETLSAMLAGISSGGAKSMVRVCRLYEIARASSSRSTLGADGVLVPYINNAQEARQAVSCARYPTAGTRSVYFPQRSMNKKGLLGYAGAWNDNAIVASAGGNGRLHQEHRRDRRRARRRHAVLRPERSVHVHGLVRKVQVPGHVHFARAVRGHGQIGGRGAQEQRHSRACSCSAPSRVGEFLEKGFPFISLGNDLHHMLTQTGAYVNELEKIAASKGKPWTRRDTALF